MQNTRYFVKLVLVMLIVSLAAFGVTAAGEIVIVNIFLV